MTNGDRVA